MTRSSTLSLSILLRPFMMILLLGAMSLTAQGQCLTASDGQYPSGTFSPSCTGSAESITTLGWASEYSVVAVTSGTEYTFSSSNSSDYLTIADNTGSTAFAFGTTPVNWTATFTGTVRMYNHTNSSCGEQASSRTRSVACAAAPCTDNLVLLELFDSFGDGWNGASLTISEFGGSTIDSYTISSGGFNDAELCLPDGCYTVNVTGGTFPAEVSWEISSGGNLVLSGGAPETGLTFSLGSSPCPILGCTNPLATNFDPAATQDDGSCIVPCQGSEFTYNAGNTGATITLGSPVTANINVPAMGTIGSNASISSATLNLTHTYTGDVDITLTSPAGTSLELTTDNGSSGDNYTNTVFEDGGANITSASAPFTGTFAPEGGSFAATFDGEAINGNWVLEIEDDGFGDDGVFQSFGLTFCLTGVVPVPGCTDPSANNFDPSATVDDGSCTYDPVPGCTDPLADNFDPSATVDDGSCVFVGCTDPLATNFDPNATQDDGSCIIPPANDDCSGAIGIACDDTVTGNTSDATSDGAPFCSTSPGSKGVWYTFLGTGDEINLSLCGSSYDTKINVYTGSCGSFSCVTGNDDFCGTRSEVTFASAPGTTYYILVSGFNASSGSFTLDVSCTPIIPGCTDPDAQNFDPTATTDDGSCIFNTACSNAEVVGLGTHSTSSISFGNGAENGCTFPLSGNASHARWFRWTPAVTGEYTIESAGFTSNDTRLSIYTGNCNNLECYASNDDLIGGSTFASSVTACFFAGTTYYIEWDNRWSSSSFSWGIAYEGPADCADLGGPLPAPWVSNDVGNAGDGNGFGYLDPSGTFNVSSGGVNQFGTTSDNYGFIHQTLCGDFTLTVRLDNVSPRAFGGIAARETTDAGAKQIGIVSNISPYAMNTVRTMMNGPVQTQLLVRPQHRWLRIQRVGNVFRTFTSFNGMFFQQATARVLPMGSCIEVGMLAYGRTTGIASAGFTDVTVLGGNAGGDALAQEDGAAAAAADARAAAQDGAIVVPAAQELRTALYPNPATDGLFVELGAEYEVGATLTLRNELGQELGRRVVEAGNYLAEWDVSGLSSGVYFMEVRTADGSRETLRFVKAD